MSQLRCLRRRLPCKCSRGTVILLYLKAKPSLLSSSAFCVRYYDAGIFSVQKGKAKVEGLRCDKVNDDITLMQSGTGLTFGSDAYLLYAYIKRFPKASKGAELGCGSGIVSLLAAAKGKLSHIHAFEVQERQAEIAKNNAAMNMLSEKVTVTRADIRELEASHSGAYDCVFTNPPYMKADSGKRNGCDEKYIARHEVMGDISDFCDAASGLLKYGGLFYAVYRPDRAADLIFSMKSAGIEPKRMTFVYPDINSRPCMMLVEGRKGGSSGMLCTMPLIMYKDASAGQLEYTEELKYIYENGEFDERYRKA